VQECEARSALTRCNLTRTRDRRGPLTTGTVGLLVSVFMTCSPVWRTTARETAATSAPRSPRPPAAVLEVAIPGAARGTGVQSAVHTTPLPSMHSGGLAMAWFYNRGRAWTLVDTSYSVLREFEVQKSTLAAAMFAAPGPVPITLALRSGSNRRPSSPSASQDTCDRRARHRRPAFPSRAPMCARLPPPRRAGGTPRNATSRN
jgi:hypothetical protein